VTWRQRVRRPHALGLRGTVTLSFAAGGLALSTLLSVGTYLVARSYLVEQRQQAAIGQAFADASFVRDGLLTAGRPVGEVLGTTSPPADAVVFVRSGGEWFSTSLTQRSDVVPSSLQEAVEGGDIGLVWSDMDGEPAVVVGVPVPAVRAQFYEISPAAELQRTLSTLATVLAAFALLTTVAGALLGRWASRRVLAPLDTVAGAAARIAGGDLGTRLPTTEDPELVTIIGSFNAMVDALAERIERDARFTADVSHELRSPLTALTTSVQLLQSRQADLPERSQQALDLVVRELGRFRAALEDLLELGRLDAGTAQEVRYVVEARELVEQALEASGRPPTLLHPDDAGPLTVRVAKGQLHRALVNLFDNADLHGDGLEGVRLSSDGGYVVIDVDDAGPGVLPADRERIFERFVRGGSRGSLPGTGLGLSLVAETLRAHGGSVLCGDSPAGGSRFRVRLPASGRRSGW
jgi:two-component system, OmpR family, sensor histidine kinase MtrB